MTTWLPALSGMKPLGTTSLAAIASTANHIARWREHGCWSIPMMTGYMTFNAVSCRLWAFDRRVGA